MSVDVSSSLYIDSGEKNNTPKKKRTKFSHKYYNLESENETIPSGSFRKAVLCAFFSRLKLYDIIYLCHIKIVADTHAFTCRFFFHHVRSIRSVDSIGAAFVCACFCFVVISMTKDQF